MTRDYAKTLLEADYKVLHANSFGEYSSRYRTIPLALTAEGAMQKAMLSHVRRFNNPDEYGRTTWYIIHVEMIAPMVVQAFNSGLIKRTSVAGMTPEEAIEGWRWEQPTLSFDCDISDWDLCKGTCFLSGVKEKVELLSVEEFFK